jgi:DNA repair protein RecN (Recombination protein N)
LPEIEEMLGKYQDAWRQWRAAVTELDELENSERASSQQIDMLKFQANEIAAANLKPGEEEEIESRHRIAANGAHVWPSSAEHHQPSERGRRQCDRWFA